MSFATRACEQDQETPLASRPYSASWYRALLTSLNGLPTVVQQINNPTT